MTTFPVCTVTTPLWLCWTVKPTMASKRRRRQRLVRIFSISSCYPQPGERTLHARYRSCVLVRAKTVEGSLRKQQFGALDADDEAEPAGLCGVPQQAMPGFLIIADSARPSTSDSVSWPLACAGNRLRFADNAGEHPNTARDFGGNLRLGHPGWKRVQPDLRGLRSVPFTLLSTVARTYNLVALSVLPGVRWYT